LIVRIIATERSTLVNDAQYILTMVAFAFRESEQAFFEDRVAAIP
jgi:hypothetical protein